MRLVTPKKEKSLSLSRFLSLCSRETEVLPVASFVLRRI